MKNFDSLTFALEDWFDKPLKKIPKPLRQRIEEDFWPLPWDRLSAEGRRSVTLQLDYQDNPATESDRQYMGNLADRELLIKSNIAKWEAIPVCNATDLVVQESNLAKYQEELTLFESQNFRGGVPIVPSLNPAHSGKLQGGRKLEQAPADDPPAKKAAGSRARLEVRKLNTLGMYKEWQKAYRVEKKKRPNMSDVWYSLKIEKMAIAKGRRADTIRKHMKS